jgi:hypothetical protein
MLPMSKRDRVRGILLSAALTGTALACCWTWAAGGAAASAGLPDERAYELVSPLGNGEVFQPPDPISIASLVGEEPMRAAADGDAVVYAGDAPASGVGGNGNAESRRLFGNEYLANRAAGGWGGSDIEPPPASESQSRPVYQSFSSDLSTGYLTSPDRPPLAGAPACKTEGDLYSRASAGGGFAALFTSTLTPEQCGLPLFAGASADGSHVLFQTEAALVAPAVPAAGPGNTQFCSYNCNLYESVGGAVSLVNLLPGGGVDTAATFGGASGNGTAVGKNLPDLSNAISADGSRVVWSDVSTGVIYVREGSVSTVQVSAGSARFWTASVDGRFVFYTEGERLLRFDVESGVREELAGAGAGVQGVVGISEDGSYVYFVANGVLAAGAASGSCKLAYPGPFFEEEEEEARCNLYGLHSGEPVRFIATLSGIDNNLRELTGGANSLTAQFGDWQSDLGSRTAEVTPSGLSVAFSSRLPLTGYDNVAPADPEHRAIPELFVYEWEGGGGQLDCASCAPDGAPMSVDVGGGSVGEEYRFGGWVHPSTWGTYVQRWLSADGSRVFFDTAQPLVAQDTNRLTDVYEWERDGAGGCEQPRGCVYLLSGGSSQDDSYFLDASANGDDVFFVTRAQLVAEDRDESFHLYDARAPHVPGEAVGFTPAAGVACTGSVCQGAAPAAPVFGAPSSATFSGAGNLAPPAPAAKPKARPSVCARGFVKRKRHGRCLRQAKSRARAPGRNAKRGRK